jgi:hypothetical protein
MKTVPDERLARLRPVLRALPLPLLLISCLACNQRVVAPVVPGASDIVVIRITKSRRNPTPGPDAIYDPSVIAHVLTLCRDTPRGWYVPPDTFPTPESSASFVASGDEVRYVLWFGPSWLGASAAPFGPEHRALAEMNESDLKRLRGLLGV